MRRRRHRPEPWSPERAAEHVIRAWHDTVGGESTPEGDEAAAQRVVRLLQVVAAQCASMAEERAQHERIHGWAAIADALDEHARQVRERFRLE